jgi:hypothetical protein
MHSLKFSLCRKLIVAGVVTLLVSAAPAVFARNAINATVLKLQSTEFNVAFVYVDIALAGTAPSCAANNTSRAFVMDISTPGGKAMFQSLMLAKATGVKVSISGRGDFPASYGAADMCSIWNIAGGLGFEMINNMIVEP